MTVDTGPFPINTTDLKGERILVKAKEINHHSTANKVIIEELREKRTSRKVTQAKNVGEKSLKITFESSSKPTGDRRPRMVKPKGEPKVGKWYKNERRSSSSFELARSKPTFKELMAKYQCRSRQVERRDIPQEGKRHNQQHQYPMREHCCYWSPSPPQSYRRWDLSPPQFISLVLGAIS